MSMLSDPNFKNVVTKLQNKLASNSTYAFWIRFKAGDLEINSYTDKNLFINFENKKNGSGMVNSFTLHIAYQPYMTPTTNRFGDINYIDKCLFANEDWKCELQYGYDYAPDNLVTPIYTGQVTGYDKEIQNGMIHYTLTGYSSIVSLVENDITENDMHNIRATEAAKKVLEKYVTDYKIIIDDSAKEKDAVQETINGTADANIFGYVNTILQSAIDIEERSDAKKSPYYTYIVDDVAKEIRIVRVSTASKSEVSFTFNWMDRSNNIVTDFRPKYDGAVLMAYGTGSKEESKVITAGADTETKISIKESVNVAQTADSDIQIEMSKWSEALKKLPMTATMTTVGIPYDIKLLTTITVNPIIYGQKDYSAGDYIITEITDNLDSGGFITTLEMFKNIVNDDDSEGVG